MTPSLSCIRSEVLMSMRLRKKVSWYSEYNHLELLLLLDSIPHIPRSEKGLCFCFALSKLSTSAYSALTIAVLVEILVPVKIAANVLQGLRVD